MDLYGPLLAKALFPAFEAARGRPTVPLLRYLEKTQYWSPEALEDLQIGLLRRVLRHAYLHTGYYRELLDERELHFDDFRSVADLAKLPLLDRDTVRLTLDARTASVPPLPVITKSTSGTTGQPVVVRYNAESRHWRDATRWRGYGWANYRIGNRALHYWGSAPPSNSWVKRSKIALDRVLKRDLYLDCTPRGEEALRSAVEQLKDFKPHVMVAYAAGAAALARFVNDQGLRDWDDIPVITGAERLWPADREQIEAAFGPAFETYGCRETMLIASECEAHDGMHVAMETMIVEIVVRENDGTVRAARPGEAGEIAVTDLHNLACPMIRYVTGDMAIAREPAPCSCGRTLGKVGSIEGRVTETLRDGHGRPVGGLVFNILFGVLDHVAEKFQVVQKLDGSVVMKVVPNGTETLPDRAVDAIRGFAAKYLPATPFEIEYVPDIPLTAAGKRNVVTVEKSPAA
jgi:phenylacetate-CoA ligase